VVNDQEEAALLRERLRETTHAAARVAEQLADAQRDAERYQARCRALELRLEAVQLAMSPKYDQARLGLHMARPEWWEAIDRLVAGPVAEPVAEQPTLGCLHLADSWTPASDLNDVPCPVCGRFYVDGP
jgi:hypothetical protein